VLAFHGGGQTASALEAMAQLRPKADASSFILVEAEGTGALGPGTSGAIDAWNAGNCCAYPSEKAIDDVAFVRATSDDVATQVCVDPQRVFATGFSNGAMLAHRLACELSDRIAAIAAVSGGMGEENLAVTPPETIFTCDPPRPVPVLHIHGTQDVCYPFDGGPSPLIGATTFEPVMTTIDGWVARNGCEPTTKTVLANGRATCKEYACPAGGAGDVELCTIQGGGHYWPGGNDWPGSETLCGMGQGVLSADLDANDALWQWFVAHPMPTP
jgi:polyhydroxybutyrate depolymerase